MSREIFVFADWEGLEETTQIGLLRVEEVRGKEVFSFSYDENWLASGVPPDLDPDLRLFSGKQYWADDGRPNFGLFLDSSPDRWGRVIMRRREAAMARREGRVVRKLRESDFLLGVHDEQRTGAIRFKLGQDGNFLDDQGEMAAPPWATLRQLEQASWNLQDEDSGGGDEELEWLDLLLAPGSSLGGARPKAGVRDPAGDLWIAKFPGRADEHDVGGWEWVTWQLAVNAGMNVAPAKVIAPTKRKHHTFASKRFDRVEGSAGAGRVHFASAMTLLGYADGADHLQGVSYLELAELITNHGADVVSDLEELWRRIVFSICVGNSDDHLRNHGFLLSEKGWRLSPAYDLNPDPSASGLSLNITEDSNTLDLDLAREVAPFFRIKSPDAEVIITQVRSSVAEWRKVASDAGLPRAQMELVAGAFKTNFD
jgi:serine/threonine-protein kinase HipA